MCYWLASSQLFNLELEIAEEHTAFRAGRGEQEDHGLSMAFPTCRLSVCNLPVHRI